ncbi:MAG: FtsX-like permease family protein [Rhabdochlamydiaceae bacterium]|nr:FtsX-like permease family protein [Rhabdochlamydiaceae bacterium]
MMFEVSVAFKYLIPRKKHLSVTLIAMMSVGVISLIVWLLLVFLSVTSGIEASWLKKLTDLNAPLRVTPTSAYFSSYYHKVDAFSSASNFSVKTLGEKKDAENSDPYNPEEDPETPMQFPKPAFDANGVFIDPVKGLISAFSELQKKHPSITFQDYEMSGALLKLKLLRNNPSGQESMQFLTQVSYLATPPLPQKVLSSLLLPLSSKDLNHLLFLANYRMENLLEDGIPSIHPSKEAFQERIGQILSFVTIHSVKTTSDWMLPASLLPENTPFKAYGSQERGKWHWTLAESTSNKGTQATIVKTEKEIQVILPDQSISLDSPELFSVENPITFQTTIDKQSLLEAGRLQEISLLVKGSLQGHTLQGPLPWKNLQADKFTTSTSTFPGEQGILLPKGFQENGALVGDHGFLSYQASTSSSLQEQRLPIFIAGFYDPGIISVGNKCLLVPKEITRSINAANLSTSFDKISLGGFQVWMDPPKQAKHIKQELIEILQQKELLPYWNVASYQDYDFAKDLLQQFQSDKMLLSLIGIIILIVACCNILSFLILLVSDKKQEIAILQAMGASTKSIASIFGICGVIVGLLGCAIGVGAALITLHNIDSLSSFLSALQGHDAFSPAFYGNSLPSTLSPDAVLFIFLATPILSLLSGLIPAIKASKLSPSSILRSES